MSAICKAASCDREGKKRGMCNMHYNRWLRGHPEDGNPKRVRPSCGFPGCGRPHTTHGLCGSHNWQRKNGKELSPIAEGVDRECAGPECERMAGRFTSHGLCHAHGAQLRTKGELTAIRDPRPLRHPEVFWTRVNKIPFGCWEWMSNVSAAGYGTLALGGGKYAYAHRYSWELLRGPIPDGLVIDHICRNRCCVNPDHLEPVTQAENVRRGREAVMN